MLCGKFGWKCSSGSGEEGFKKVFNIKLFLIFCTYLPFEKGMTLHLKKKIESSSPKDALCQVWLKLDQWFWRRRFFCFQFIFTISQLSPPWEGLGSLFEQTWILSTQGCFVPSLVEIVPVDLEKKIDKKSQFIFIISQLPPPWEGLGSSFEQTWIPFTRGYFVPSLVEISQVVLEKRWKYEKFTDRQTDRQTTDYRWSEKFTWAFS